MKLFIWEDSGTLQDWTNGMIVVVAEDLEGAHRAIAEKCHYAEGAYAAVPSRTMELADVKPEAWVCWGGG
jgi:hypothetical protein